MCLISGGQVSEYTMRGRYLLLVLPAYVVGKEPAPQWTALRAVVRYTTLKQCGHFSSGYLKIGAREKVYVSGGFGSDGLPRDADPALYDACIPVPPDLATALAKSDSHSTGDYSAEWAIRKWARANQDALSKAGRNLDKPARVVQRRKRPSRRGLSTRERFALEFSEARRIQRGRGKRPAHRWSNTGQVYEAIRHMPARVDVYRPGRRYGGMSSGDLVRGTVSDLVRSIVAGRLDRKTGIRWAREAVARMRAWKREHGGVRLP